MKLLLSVIAIIIGSITWLCLDAFGSPFLPALISTALIAGGIIIILSDLLNKK
jgi:energy-converting hydrogenase Eha subunit C